MMLALLFISCFQLRVFAVGEGLLFGGAMSLGIQLFYDLMMIGINSSGGMDSIRTNFNNQSIYPSMKDYIGYLGEQWVSDVQSSFTWDSFLNNFGQDLRYNSSGVLNVDNTTSDYIHSFMEWLNENDYIDVSVAGDTTYPSQSGSLTINSLSDGMSLFNYAIALNSRGFTISSGALQTVSSFINNNSSHPIMIRVIDSSSDFKGYGAIVVYAFTGLYVNSNFTVGSSYTCTYISSDVASSNSSAGDPIIINSFSSKQNTSKFVGNSFSYGYGYYRNNVNADVTVGSNGYDVWNQDDADDGYIIDAPSALNGLGSAAAGSIANIGDLVDALADAIAGVESPAIPVAGSEAIPVSIPADLVIPVDVALPVDLVDTVPVEGDATEPYTGTGAYTLALADFFPFCIPFDIYNMLSLLSADPVAPAFTWQFYVPGGGTIPIEVDLSVFNTVASVLRTMEILGFCVGLAVGTKKLLFGS